MSFLSTLPGILVFRINRLCALAEMRALIRGILCFSMGFLAYNLVRNSVYAALPELLSRRPGPLASFLNLNIIQSVLFVLLIYIPALILLSIALSGNKPSLHIFKQEYRKQASALLSLWGIIFLIAAPVQWIDPRFLVVGIVEISIGALLRTVLLLIYTLWAIKQLNQLSFIQAFSVFILASLTFLIYLF
jgi:hypothetical protein